MDLDEARKHAGLNPLPGDNHAEPKKERGHARGQTDDRRLQDKALRGIPCVGAGPGAIEDSIPGGEIGAAARLEQAGRDIIAANLKRNRYHPKP